MSRVGRVAAALLLAGCTARAPVAAPPRVLQVNRTGEPAALATVLVPGHVTVLDFWADWCGACKLVDANLTAALADAPGVVVRKIDVGDGETPVARQHQVGALPHVRVYDRRGRLRYVLAGNAALTAGETARELAREP